LPRGTQSARSRLRRDVLEGPHGWIHTAALRRRHHPRHARFSRGAVTKAQAPDAGGDDPRIEHGLHRRFCREHRPARDPAGAARGRGIDAMDRQRLFVAARRAGAGRRLGRRSLRPPADFSCRHCGIYHGLHCLRALTKHDRAHCQPRGSRSRRRIANTRQSRNARRHLRRA